MSPTFQPVIVGYGRAGRDLHHRALRSLFGDVHAVVVDPRPVTDPGTTWVSGLDDVPALVPLDRALFHVTTPPEQHLPTMERLVALGARHVIMEKPIAPRLADARRIAELAVGLDVLPVGVWLASATTDAVRRVVAAGEIGAVVALHFEQSKPRFRRNLNADDGHATAFDVEMPHQVLLALHLGGTDADLVSAAVWSMPDAPLRGGATLVLHHRGGVTSTLHSDLTAPQRVRRLVLTGTAGRIVADYPLSSEDDFGQIRVSTRGGRRVVEDAPLTRFVAGAYGTRDAAHGDLDLHVRSIDLLEQARRTADLLPPQSMEIETWRG